MDKVTKEHLQQKAIRNVGILSIEDISRHDARFYETQNNRQLVEFYFTSKSFLCQYLFDMYPNVNLLTYLDADLYFFGDPRTIVEEMNNYSVGLTPHRFPERLHFLEIHGRFNAGLISIRRDETGLACLKWWNDRCVEWCRDIVDRGRFADQGYLDQIPGLFPRVHCMDHKGINLAPWNMSQYKVTWSGTEVLVDEQPLILFHFHGLKRKSAFLFDSGTGSYGAVLGVIAKEHIYRPYVEDLQEQDAFLPRDEWGGSIRTGWMATSVRSHIFNMVVRFLVRVMDTARAIYYRSYIWSGRRSR